MTSKEITRWIVVVIFVIALASAVFFLAQKTDYSIDLQFGEDTTRPQSNNGVTIE